MHVWIKPEEIPSLSTIIRASVLEISPLTRILCFYFPTFHARNSTFKQNIFFSFFYVSLFRYQKPFFSVIAVTLLLFCSLACLEIEIFALRAFFIFFFFFRIPDVFEKEHFQPRDDPRVFVLVLHFSVSWYRFFRVYSVLLIIFSPSLNYALHMLWMILYEEHTVHSTCSRAKMGLWLTDTTDGRKFSRMERKFSGRTRPGEREEEED